MSDYIFKMAATKAEIQSVHKLNYRTFVEEIPQHASNPTRVLIDRYDHENTYFIALKDKTLVGMVAVRGNRPFSLDQKVDNLESYLPPHRQLCEIRLLSVEQAHRNGTVFKGLMYELLRHANEKSYDLAVISGTVRQLKLYRNMGFVPFGPLVGKEGAMFQPMYLSKESFKSRLSEMPTAAHEDRAAGHLPLNFLPGPVSIKPNVKQAFTSPAISHRSERFKIEVKKIKTRLRELTGAAFSEILLGSGTLANDAIAWQLKQLDMPGLVLTAGEFGERLVDHARRANLDFRIVEINGEAFQSQDSLSIILDKHPETRWIWAVHCETSTGEMIDLPMLRSLCSARSVKLCVDIISTFGIMPIDLRDIYFASAVSGKGVGGYPGLSMVFYSHPIQPPRLNVPRYLDLYVYAENDGIPYTHSSNLMEALGEALTRYPEAANFEQLKKKASWLCQELKNMGCEIVSRQDGASPAVVTIALPDDINSEKFGDKLADNGCLLSYQSGYLLRSNRVQICMMSKINKKSLQQLLGHMQTHIRGCAEDQALQAQFH